jgi:hypothetical protein
MDNQKPHISLAILFLVCLSAVSLYAQNETAVLAGLVTDPSGAAVPNAQLRLTNDATGATRQTISSALGEYRFDLLEPGDYSLRVTANGFRPSETPKLHLQVAQTSQFNVALTLGTTTEAVTVQADVSPLTTESVGQGTVITQEKVQALPLNGRQFLQLALLSPGVSSGGIAVQQNSLRQGEIGGISVAGSRTNDSAYLLDGVVNTDPDYNALSYVPSVDAIAEFQVQVAQYSAEYGRASGGQINVITRSGSNEFHASAWEFVRNNIFDTRPFNLTTQPDVPQFQRNQFGVTAGGPIRKNKLFAFFNYEALRTRQAGANLTTIGVPDSLQRTGNFSGEIATTKIYDPNSPIVGGSRTAFAGNIIPTGRIDPSVLAAMAALPLPNLPGGLFINTTDVLKQDFNNYSGRVDYQINDNLKAFTRYSGASENASIPVVLPNRDNLDNALPQNVAVGLTQVLSSNKVNDIRLGFNRLNFLYGLPEPSFSSTSGPIPNFIVGQLNFGGAGPYNATGQGGIAQARNNTYQLWDVFAWTFGKHSVRLGGEVDLFQYVRFEYADPLGSLTFTSGYTNQTAKAGGAGGDSLASALLGLPSTAVRTLGPSRIDGRQQNYALFVQDDYRIRPGLTANIGLRYEVSPPLYDIRNQLASINFGTSPSPQTIFAAGTQGAVANSPTLFVCGKDGTPAGCAYTNWRNFSPRVGLAWSVNSKTVIRAGGGVYYGTQDDNTLLKMAQSLPTTYAQTLTYNAFVPGVTGLNNVFTPAIVGTAAIQAASIDIHQGTPYSPEWSLNVQRSVGAHTTLEVGYLGSAGVHLEQNVQPNNGLPGPTAKRPYYGLQLSPAVQQELAFPLTATTVPVSSINYFPHSAHSTYHALVVRAERKYTSGFALLNSFTWSKTLTNAPQYRNAGGISGDENSPPQNSFNLAAEKSLAYFNNKYRWVTSGVYDLPFGKGKKMAPDGVGAAILGGWQVSGILQLQTGFPYTINYKGDPVNIGGGSGGILIRPNYVLGGNGQPVDPNLPSDRRSTSEYFNTAAFVQPINSFGNVGRNSMTGASLVNVDATVARGFHLTEKVGLQFRAEFFNLANHPNYNLIGRIVNDPTYGIVQNQLPPRQVQFALKLGF